MAPRWHDGKCLMGGSVALWTPSCPLEASDTTAEELLRPERTELRRLLRLRPVPEGPRCDDTSSMRSREVLELLRYGLIAPGNSSSISALISPSCRTPPFTAYAILYSSLFNHCKGRKAFLLRFVAARRGAFRRVKWSFRSRAILTELLESIQIACMLSHLPQKQVARIGSGQQHLFRDFHKAADI